ncbi:MAG: LysR family transcriptional regulator [Saccharopolyspora rectivirgula]|jgi:DNA-binding transcriptional LysR family regulator
MLNPIHLRTLQECVRTGSFAEAGRALGYTASAVSQQMMLLEKAVGAPLFERAARSARSTKLAGQLAERSRSALRALEALEREVRAMVSGEQGQLRLASFPTANARVLPDVLANIVAGHPSAEVQLDEGEPDEVTGAVLDGAVDAAVVYEYDLDPRQWPAELRVQDLMTDPLWLVVPSGHRCAGAGEVDLADLAEEKWICTREDTSGARSLERLAAAAGFLPQVVFRSNDYGVIRDLVSRGLGIAVLPALALPESGAGALRMAHWQPCRRIKVLHRPQNTNPLLPVALELLAESCAEVGRGRAFTTGSTGRINRVPAQKVHG